MEAMLMKFRTIMLAGLLVASVGCDKKADETAEEAPEQTREKAKPMVSDKQAPSGGDENALAEIAVASSAFEEGGTIPTKFTCDGENLSVPLTWSSLPQGAESVAVVMHDPDAPKGTFYHWGIWAIPAEINEVAAGLAKEPQISLPSPDKPETTISVFQAKNQTGEFGYAGPCPPKGDDAHRYIFQVFALDHPGATFSEPPGVQQLLAELKADAIARGSLTGVYKRAE
jgi:Raf kinase inhibitor-like YbhB/YbcL family protein